MTSQHPNYQISQVFGQAEPQQKKLSNHSDFKAYYAYSHSSPYIDGKKNSQYVHPSLISNQVFYNQNDSFKNQLPNKTRPYTSSSQSNNRFLTEERHLIQDERPITTNHSGRIDSRRNYNRNDEDSRYTDQVGPKNEHHYYARDDKSDTSTLSSTGYLCPNCLNRHIYEDQKNLCKRQRDEDIEREKRLTDINKRVAHEEEEQNRLDRNKRVAESKELREKLDQGYNAKLENRRSPKKEVRSAFDNLFERQDDLVEKNRAKNQEFRSSLQDQMRQSSIKKNQDKASELSPYGTSLQIGEGYQNKYIERASNSIGEALKDQVQEKTQKQRREREIEKRLEQEKSEQSLRAQDEEEQRKQQKEWKQKNELKGHLLKTIEDNKNKKLEEIATKINERTLVDQQYLNYKRKQAEEETKAKRQLFDYGKVLNNEQEYYGYKKKYEDRRQQKEATSFDPSPTKAKKLYPCGECNIPFEKNFLTKHH